MSSNKDERATQIFNSILKKYIPDNSTFETWYSTPYDGNERVDVFIEYSFDSNDTHFWKTDVQEDDEPIQYEGTIYLLINRLMVGNVEDDTWEDVWYHDVPSFIWDEDFNDAIIKKIKPLIKSFNVGHFLSLFEIIILPLWSKIFKKLVGFIPRS